MEKTEEQRVHEEIFRAAHACALVVQRELERTHGPDWLERVNAARTARGYAAGRGTHDHRFVLALVAHDPALALVFDEEEREAAKSLNGMANALAHNEPLRAGAARAEELAQRLITSVERLQSVTSSTFHERTRAAHGERDDDERVHEDTIGYLWYLIRREANDDEALRDQEMLLTLYSLVHARHKGDRTAEADHCFTLAFIDFERVGAQARARFARAADLFGELGDPAREAEARGVLVFIDLDQSAYEQARAQAVRLLDLRRELGERANEVATLALLEQLDDLIGPLKAPDSSGWSAPNAHDLPESMIDYLTNAFRQLLGRTQARTILKPSPDHTYLRLGQWSTSPRSDLLLQFLRAWVAHGPSSYGHDRHRRARSTLLLEVALDLDDRAGEAAARWMLAYIDLDNSKAGGLEQSVARFTRVADLYRELGDRAGEASTCEILLVIVGGPDRDLEYHAVVSRLLELRFETGEAGEDEAVRQQLDARYRGLWKSWLQFIYWPPPEPHNPQESKIDYLANAYRWLLGRELFPEEDTILEHALTGTYAHSATHGINPSGAGLLHFLRSWVAYVHTEGHEIESTFDLTSLETLERELADRLEEP